MGAVQRYCNKVIYVKDGILEKSENLQDITNKYSEDNLETFENQTVSSKKNKQDKAKIWIEKQSNSIVQNVTEKSQQFYSQHKNNSWLCLTINY